MLEQEAMMTTDELFNSCIVKDSAKVLAEECYGYIYDAYFYVKVEVDSSDTKMAARLMRKICCYVELNPLVEIAGDDGSGRYCVLDTTKSRNRQKLLHYVSGMKNIIRGALDAGAFLFVRLYEGNPSYVEEDNAFTLKFANVTTKDVSLNYGQLMAVLEEMFSHQCVGFCIRFE